MTLEHLVPACAAARRRAGWSSTAPPRRRSPSTCSTFPHGERGRDDRRVRPRGGRPVRRRLPEGLPATRAAARRWAPSDSIRMGDRLRVEVAVEGLDAVPEAMLTVTFSSNLSQCLFRVTSQMHPLAAAHPRRPHEAIVLDLPSLPLTPGDYSIELHLRSPDGAVDFVRRCGRLHRRPRRPAGHRVPLLRTRRALHGALRVGAAPVRDRRRLRSGASAGHRGRTERLRPARHHAARLRRDRRGPSPAPLRVRRRAALGGGGAALRARVGRDEGGRLGLRRPLGRGGREPRRAAPLLVGGRLGLLRGRRGDRARRRLPPGPDVLRVLRGAARGATGTTPG